MHFDKILSVFAKKAPSLPGDKNKAVIKVLFLLEREISDHFF
jgi:hypothetical protein